MQRVWSFSRAQKVHRLVLLALADNADEEQFYAWPSVATLASKANVSERTVQRALRDLEATGEIRLVREGGRRQEEQPDGSVKTIYRAALYQVTLRGDKSVAPDVEGVPDSAWRGDRNVDRGVTPLSPQPLREPSEEPLEEPRAARSRSSKRILKPEEEPDGFSQWLGEHVAICEKWGIKREVPRAGSTARSDRAREFAALLEEGYELEDFTMASEGVLADEFMRNNGHTKPENVLRKSKFQGRIDDGWRAREAESKRVEDSERLGQYEGLVSN